MQASKKRTRISMVSLAVLALTALIWMVLQSRARDAEVLEPQNLDSGELGASERNAVQLDESRVSRSVMDEPEAMPIELPDAERCPVDSDGPLTPAEKSSLLSMLEKQLRSLEAELAALEPDAEPLARELKEAELLYQRDKQALGIELLQNDIYATHADRQMPHELESFDPIWSQVLRGTPTEPQWSLVAVYVPTKNLAFGASIQRAREARFSYWQARANRFNALPIEERRAQITAFDDLMTRLQSLREQPQTPLRTKRIRELELEASLLTGKTLDVDRDTWTLRAP